MPRRRPGALTPLQREVLTVLAAAQEGDLVHGFALADRLRDGKQARALIGHGTLYKVLNRLLEEQLVSAVWEDPAIAEAARRPRRRFYAATAQGVAALARAAAQDPVGGAPAVAGAFW